MAEENKPKLFRPGIGKRGMTALHYAVTAHRECVWTHWIQSSRVRDSQLRTANKLTCIYADHPIVIGPSSIRVSASSIFSRLNILTRFRKEVLSWRRILAAE